MTIYIVCMYFISLLLAYVLAFTGATLNIGMSLSDAESSTSYQDAITPPWFSTFAILTYIISVLGLIFGLWNYGIIKGLGVIIGFLLAVVLNKVIIVPKSEGKHFRNIIIRSMIGRYADYLKNNDALRAAAMSHLLEKLGMPVDDINISFEKQ